MNVRLEYKWIADQLSLPAPVKQMAKEALLFLRRPTVPWRLRPTFFLIGGMKCGTTSLFGNVVKHPLIAPPVTKEIRYFDFNYHRGPTWYRAHFPLYGIIPANGTFSGRPLVTGEASPSYMIDPHAARRLKKFAPDAKLIMLLRNPVDRAYSHYQHSVRYWGETVPFPEAIAREEERIGSDLQRRLEDGSFRGVNLIRYSYLTRGRYLESIKQWVDLFGRDQILVLKSDDYFREPAKTFKRVISFLELPSWNPKDFKKLNIAKYRSLDSTIRDKLYNYFEPYNRELYEFLGEDFNWEAER